jgi:hypothetical protein
MATRYFNTTGGGSSGNWSDPNNWWTGPQGDAPTNGFYPPDPNDDIIMESDCNNNMPLSLVYNITIQNSTTLTLVGDTNTYSQNSNSMSCYGTLNIDGNVTFGFSNLIIYAGGVVGNNGVLNGTINTNSGTLNINGGSSFSGGINGNYGTFYNGGTSNCTITTNFGSINNTGDLSMTLSTNEGTFSNSSGTFNGSIGNNIATITNSGTFTINSNTINSSTGTFTNNAGTFTSNGTFTNNGIFACNNASTFINNTTFVNNGTTTVAATAYLSFRPTTSIFTNNGTFTFGAKYTTRFKGEIFPQIPSSASWGNALL